MSDQKKISGAVIGGWVCLVIATGLLVLSLLYFVLYLPLFLAAFVLGIVAIAQRSIINGILILLLSIAVPTTLGLGLGARRTIALFKDDNISSKHYVPRDDKHPRPLVVERCRDCHAPDKIAPQSPHHPPKEKCMLCHRDAS